MRTRAAESHTLQEIELKFQVPAAQRAAVERAVHTVSARQTRLQACYVDTPDRRLAQARAALRLRREGERWVQTLKAEGDSPMQRLEHEVVLSPGRGRPALDLRRHAGTPAAAALARALGLAPEEAARRVAAGDRLGLVETFETDILRTHRELRVAGGRVELAWDVGHIRAGGRSLALCELEMELCAGPPEVLVDLARRWVLRHGLWLDVRSKAERGDLLARGEWASPPAPARPPHLDDRMTPGDALRAMVRSGLSQALANASVLADAELEGRLTPDRQAEHLHQWRVGLRRLRSALRVFGHADAASGRPDTAVPPTWEPALQACFARLGARRDEDALAASILPALQAAGAPWVQLPRSGLAAETPGDLARDRGLTGLLLAMLGWAHPSARPAPAGSQRKLLRQWASAQLAPLQRQLRQGADRADTLDEAGRHRLRKRLKRLRYGLEFAAPWLPAKRTQAQLSALRQALDALGHGNDLATARRLFEAACLEEPRALWALGWLAAESATQTRRCNRQLRLAARCFKA